MRTSFKYLVNSILILICITSSCMCLEFDKDEIEKFLKDSLKCRDKPGMAVAVVKDGKILYSGGFGVTDLDTKTPVTDETLFGIASISKSFAAALFVKLLYQNTNLTIDSKVRDLLGDDFVMPDDLRTYETTFLDLLSHRTAMLSNNRIRTDEDLTRNTILSRLRYLPSNKVFRSDFIYNNLVYGLLSRIAELLGGGDEIKWEELVHQHFFQPLGMTKSTFATRVDFTRKDLARGYQDSDSPGQYYRTSSELSRRWAELCGSGSVVTSAKDMTKWMLFHMSEGRNDRGETVLDPKLVKQLHKKRTFTGRSDFFSINQPQFPVTSDVSSYALGLRTGYYRGYRLLGHTGSTFGYTSMMYMLPTENIGVVVLLNSRDSKFVYRSGVFFYLMDRALGLHPWINSTTICTFPSPWREEPYTPFYRPKRDPDAKLKLPVDEYKGTYTHKGFGTINISYNDTLDSIVGNYGWGDWELYLWPNSKGDDQEERFFGEGLGPIFAPDIQPLYFITDPNKTGEIVGIKAKFIDSNLPPTFCKDGHTDVCKKIEAETLPKDDTHFCKQSKGSNSQQSVHFNSSRFVLVIMLVILMLS